MSMRINANLNKINPSFKAKEPAVKNNDVNTNLLKQEAGRTNQWTKILGYGAGSLALIVGGYKGVNKLLSLNANKKLAATRKMLIEQQGKTSVYSQFPELRLPTESLKTIIEKNRVKRDNGKPDIDFFKDEFVRRTIRAAKRLKVVREATNPKLHEAFSKKNFCFIDDGLMIHGSDRPEKKELFNHFINQAKEHEIEIVNIDTKDGNALRINTEIIKQFTDAESRYFKDMKHTMIVLEDADDLLRKDDGFARGAWNKYSHDCGMKGTITLTTAKTAETLDPTCIRRERIKYTIDIDEALKNQAEADADALK